MKEDFFTFSESIRKENLSLTPSMEDYLEMVYRLSMERGFTRIQELSNMLHVQPPSVTRMIQKLAELGLVHYEKYGVIRLTGLGKLKGSLLLSRHNIVATFLKSIGVRTSLLEETEKIEHTISKETQICIADFLSFLQENPEILVKFQDYKNAKDNARESTSKKE